MVEYTQELLRDLAKFLKQSDSRQEHDELIKFLSVTRYDPMLFETWTKTSLNPEVVPYQEVLYCDINNLPLLINRGTKEVSIKELINWRLEKEI